MRISGPVTVSNQFMFASGKQENVLASGLLLLSDSGEQFIQGIIYG
jgi:hypothetical protein